MEIEQFYLLVLAAGKPHVTPPDRTDFWSYQRVHLGLFPDSLQSPFKWPGEYL